MAPHLTPGPDDAVDAYRAKLEAYKRSTRNKVLAAIGAVVVLAIVGLALSAYFDPARALYASRPTTDPIKAKYCKILDLENARPADDPKAPPPTTVRATGTSNGEPWLVRANPDDRAKFS
jgi:hypothetical protein